ncbi:MAG: FAD-binding oxidoreductase [Actinomycetota bacterium]|nr:MAG: FAD-binding oxidoreductase [Actinomycetota bacterium]
MAALPAESPSSAAPPPSSAPAPEWRALTGWGRTAPTVAQVVSASDEASIREALTMAGERGVIARGLGRSYGAPSQNGGGLVIEIADDGSRAVGEIVIDEQAGTVTAPASVSIDTLLKVLVPAGWFVPVTPGTRLVTLGGAVASDIHGKNHHVDGSLGNHIESMRLLLADGTATDISPSVQPELFWATIGGMGLTGVVLQVTLRVLRIETSRMLVDTQRCPDLDAVCAAMAEGDADHRYSVAWIDLVATGRHLGRSVLTRADHAGRADLAKSAEPFAYHPRVLAGVPPLVPDGMLSRWSVRAFNEVWYRKAPANRSTSVQSIGSFFHPLDAVTSWNRLYGRHGFLQYQFVVPFAADDVLRHVVERLANSGASSFLAVLKRFGEANAAPLSFPMPGWTLTLDIPAARAGIGRLLPELDELVLGAGGRHYLAKDSHLTAADIRRGYPRLPEWRQVRDKADPTGLFTSDLARRLELVG